VSGETRHTRDTRDRARPTHVVVLGGGFGGLATVRELERLLPARANVRVTLVNRDNYFLFTPMLHEVAASDLDITTIVNPLRKLVRRTAVLTGTVERIDTAARTVTVSHADGGHSHDLRYDHLVIALGAVTNFFGIPGMDERAITMKSLGDAIELRNRLIQHLEEADFECNASIRAPLLTCVVAGGGFAGVETVAAVNDFLRAALRFYPNLAPDDLRVMVVHPGEFLLPELGEALGRYARERLAERGVEIALGTRVAGLDGDAVVLSDGRRVDARTVVWTAGNAANPVLRDMPCATERGRVVVDAYLRVPTLPGVWALGDCAHIADPTTGGAFPPTAQHALREGRCAARNIVAELEGRPPGPFAFSTIGLLAAIGRRTGVANVLGVNFSGFVAWWLWRTIYLAKLPRLEKKLRVALDWTLDVLFSKDLVQFGAPRIRGVGNHFRAATHLAGEPEPRGLP
jgi:NADH:ubiquinone reductase (H+-translocating)